MKNTNENNQKEVQNMDELFTTLKNTEEENGMETIFNTLEVNEVENKNVENTTENKKDDLDKMKADLKETLLTNPEYMEKKNSLSDSVEVVNSLGFGESGNIVVDKSSKERKLITTSQIVGYKIKNIGNEKILYSTEVWEEKDGVYKAKKAERALEPGKEADLTRMYMAILCARPEISFKLKNGKIVKGSGVKTAKTAREELEAYYFRFDRDDNGNQKQINDPDVKKNVGEKKDNKWIVSKSYEETFGFLNNEEKSKKSEGKSKKEQFTRQDIAANHINRLIEEAGLLVN